MLEERRAANQANAIFPCVLKTLQIINKRNPMIIGVDVVDGIVKHGTPICAVKIDPTTGKKAPLLLGKVASLEVNHMSKDNVRKGTTNAGVAMRLDAPSGQQPTWGRHVDENDTLYSLITRKSIDTLKDPAFRSSVPREDWLLIKKLKTTFNIEKEQKESGIVDVDPDDDDTESDFNSSKEEKCCSSYFDDSCDILQDNWDAEYLHQVLSVNFKCLRNLLNFDYDATLGIKPNEQVVVKNLDMLSLEEYAIRNRCRRKLDIYQEYWEDEMYKKVYMYERIWEHNRNCNPNDFVHVPKFIYSGEIEEDANMPRLMGRWISGPFLVIEYLKDLKHPEIDEQLIKAEMQVQKLAKLGIEYDDIRRQSFLYDEKNDVAHITDFQFARII
ncbi:unnamed protein product [Ambrosiozyma monospora]|uniref:Unnamed protein product n=1 Tax=Ambrosiozyma monospora TaxID=43982 RepID=A0ACB5SZL9_AMBMO|nr:unnamed protein product [Ambrosiozyma monospora]